MADAAHRIYEHFLGLHKRLPRPGEAMPCPEGISEITDADIDELRRLIMQDSINPSHYRQGAVECIEALESMLTPAEFRAHCRATAVKYLWRATLKGDERENLEKAQWYIDRAIRSLHSHKLTSEDPSNV